MLKLDIITLVLIAIITFIILYFCHSSVREPMSSAIYPLITNNFYSHIYFTNVVNDRKDNSNIYFIANKRAGDNRNLYFMNHNMQIVKKLKPPNPDNYDRENPNFKITDNEITSLSFVITFNNIGVFKTNKMTIMKLRKNDAVEDSNIESLFSETIKASGIIESLKDVYFVRNVKGDPSKGFKIVKRYNDTTGFAYLYLEIDYSKGSNQVGYFFKKGSELSQKYKHTFYLIPYLCPFEKERNPDVKTYSRGFNCLWRNQL